MANSIKSVQEILAARLAKLDAQRAEAEAEVQSEDKHHSSLLYQNQQNFFIVDGFDSPLKGDLISMEHPLFSLKAGDTKDRFYEHNGNTLEIRPNSYGMATMHDKDIWIYCISSLINAKNQGKPISRIVEFTAYDFLKATNRKTSGDDYLRLKAAFDRLTGTRIITNIKTLGYQERRNFGLLDEYRIVYKDELDDTSPMIAVRVVLPDWLFRSILEGEIKTISADYFRIRKPLDRRIYELCAKHCGQQPEWSISLELLHKKSGSTAPLRNFRIAIKGLANSNLLPDYAIRYDEKRDMVKVRNRSIKALIKQVRGKSQCCKQTV